MATETDFGASRICIVNLPNCTHKELENICAPFANVKSSLIHNNVGFVQLLSEEDAIKAANTLNGSTFKGNTLKVYNVAAKEKQMELDNDPENNQKYLQFKGNANVIDPFSCNDCEIIVMSRIYTIYAEMIEGHLKLFNMNVDILFPIEEVPLQRVLANIATRGTLYAILVQDQHQERYSVTVHILQGQPAEHRNMPVNDALNLIYNDFQRRRHLQMLKTQTMITERRGEHKSNVPIIPQSNLLPTKTSNSTYNVLGESHPKDIRQLLNRLCVNLPLSVNEYDEIIHYLQKCRDFQLKLSGNVSNKNKNIYPMLLQHIEKTLLTERPKYQMKYQSLQDVKNDEQLLKLLHDKRIQNALDNLLNSTLRTTVADMLNLQTKY